MSSTGTNNARRALLLAIVAVLAVAVIADRLGVFTGGGGADDEPAELSAAERYRAEAATAANQDALLDSADEIRAALAEAEQRWSRIQPVLLAAPTLPIAAAEFRERTIERLRREGITSVTATAVSVRTAEAAEGDDESPLRPVALSVRFETTDAAAAFSAIDALERADDPRARITRLAIDGPSTNPADRTMTVNLTLRTVALVATAGDTQEGGS